MQHRRKPPNTPFNNTQPPRHCPYVLQPDVTRHLTGWRLTNIVSTLIPRVARDSNGARNADIHIPDDATDAEWLFHRIRFFAYQHSHQLIHSCYQHQGAADLRTRLDDQLRRRNVSTEEWLHHAATYLQTQLVTTFKPFQQNLTSAAILTSEAIDLIRSQIGEQPILQLNAQNGYVAHELQKRGFDAIATDFNRTPHHSQRLFAPVTRIKPRDAVDKYADRAVFLTQPPDDRDNLDAVATVSNPLIYLGTPAQTRINQLIDQRFDFTAHCSIPSYPGEIEYLIIYLPKVQRA